MRRIPIVAFSLLPLLCACGGGAGSSAAPPPLAAPASQASLEKPQLSQAQSEAISLPLVQSTPGPNDLLYVSNAGNNSITVYPHDVAGNAAPIRVIAGSKTGINNPGQLSEDAHGNLYVTNLGTFSGDHQLGTGVLVFARGAQGNVAPIRTLTSSNPAIHLVDAAAVDESTGKLFVFDEPAPQDEGLSTAIRFPAAATGGQAPLAVSAVGLPPAVQLAFDSTGQNMIEAYKPPCCNAENMGIRTLPREFPNGASVNAVFDIYAFRAEGVADDPQTKTFLATETGGSTPGIYRFAENTTGHFPYNGTASTIAPPVVSIITSDTCGGQLAVGYLRNIYVTHSTLSGCPYDAVYVYTPSAAGNSAPLRHLHGPATQLNAPSGIYEGE